MKRILIFALVALTVCLKASAQEHVDTVQAGVDVVIEVMHPVYHKKDPMTKQPGRTKWHSEHVAFAEYDDGSIAMGLMNPPTFFSKGRNFMGDVSPFNTCKVGVYTPDGELILLAEKWKVVPSQGGELLYFVKQSKAEDMRTGKKISVTHADIFNLLKETKGYVRFIADMRGDYNMDVSARLEL